MNENLLISTSKMLAPAGGGCHNPFRLDFVKATSLKVRKHDCRYKNYDYVYLKNNKVYSYHGEGQFVFTKDFFPPNHEIYAISNQ